MKRKRYEGSVERVTTFIIYLNINHLEKGKYMLKIIHKNKIVKTTYFTKE